MTTKVENYENGVLTISLSGKIDSLNSFEVEENLTQYRLQNPADTILWTAIIWRRSQAPA